jgi:thioredoxin reductase
MKTFDAVIVGGGPGGLAAALALGRGRASALLIDGGTPRNARAHAVHTFVTRDGTPPADFRAIAREQLRAYPSIELRDAIVSRIDRLATAADDGAAFGVHAGAETVRARRVLLTTGVRDELPAIPGLAGLWGRTVFQCPYCHGWELRDRPWGVLASSEMMAAFASLVTNWASHVTAFTNGASLSPEAIEKLCEDGITIVEEPIARLHGRGEAITSVELTSGRLVSCEAFAMRPAQRPVDLVTQLGLELDETGFVRIQLPSRESSVPGIHVAGDATTMMQSAIIAAAEGTIAATMMNHVLVEARLARNRAAGHRTR